MRYNIYFLFFLSFSLLVPINILIFNSITISTSKTDSNKEISDYPQDNYIFQTIDSESDYSQDLSGQKQENSVDLKNSHTEVENSFLNSLHSTYIASFNTSQDDIVRSGDKIEINITPTAPLLKYEISWEGVSQEVNVSNTNRTIITLPTLNVSENTRDIRIIIWIYDSELDYPNPTYFNVIDLVINDHFIFITGGSFENSLKIPANAIINFTFSPSPAGYNWKWEDDISYTGLNTIRAPLDHGDHVLSLILVNGLYEDQYNPDTGLPYQFHFYVDTEAPELIPEIDFSEKLLVGTKLSFYNVTETLHPTNNPFADLTTFYFNFTSLDLFYVNSFPNVPLVPHGSYLLKVSIQDEVGNYNNASYIIQTKITILSVNPELSAQPNTSMLINISETPSYVNYSWYFQSGLMFNSSDTYNTPPLVPSLDGNYQFEVFVEDSSGNNHTFLIPIFKVDSVPLNYITSNPENNTELYNVLEIFPLFDEIPAFIYHEWNNAGENVTGPIILPNISSSHILDVYVGDLALNFIKVSLYYKLHINQKLIGITDHQIVDPGFSVNISFSEPPQITFIHWDNNIGINGSLVSTPATSTKHFLNVTTVSTYNIITSYYYDFTIRIFADLTNQTINGRYQSGLPIYLNFSDIPQQWLYRWDNAFIWKFDNNPILPTSEGTHILYIRIINDYDDSFDESFQFLVDNSPPVVEVNPITNFKIKSGQNVTLQITEGPSCLNSSCISMIEYSWNDGLKNKIIFYNDTTFPLQLTVPEKIPLGISANLSVNVSDIAGNHKEYYFEYVLDNFYPLILSTNYLNNSILRPHNITDLIIDFDENVESGNLTIVKNGQIFDSKLFSGTQIRIFSDELGYGNSTFDFVFNVSDSFANNGEINLTYVLQDKALQIEKLSPIMYKCGPNYPLNFNYNKPILYQEGVWKDQNGTLIKQTGLNTTTPAISGVYLFSYAVKDYQELWRNETLNYEIDAHAPSFMIKDITLIDNTTFDYSEIGRERTQYNITYPQPNNSSIIRILFDDGSLFNGSIHFQVTDIFNTVTSKEYNFSLKNDYILEHNFENTIPLSTIIDFSLTDEFGNKFSGQSFLNFQFINNTVDNVDTSDELAEILANPLIYVLLFGGIGISTLLVYIKKKK